MGLSGPGSSSGAGSCFPGKYLALHHAIALPGPRARIPGIRRGLPPDPSLAGSRSVPRVFTGDGTIEVGRTPSKARAPARRPELLGHGFDPVDTFDQEVVAHRKSTAGRPASGQVSRRIDVSWSEDPPPPPK